MKTLNPRNLYLFFFVFTLTLTNVALAQQTPSKAVRDKLFQVYKQIKKPEISFEKFLAVNSHVYANQPQTQGFATLAIPDYCSKVRTYCANSDFEAGLDQNEYTGAFGYWISAGPDNLNPDPFSLTVGFSSGDISFDASHQTIVNKASGADPTTGISLVPPSGGNQALRLGNTEVSYGTEVIAKTIVVDPAQTILGFYYAVVFEDPGHPFDDQPAFSVRVYDCSTGLQLPTSVCNLGNGSNIAVSDATNPFFKSLNSNTIAYRDWSKAQINLSAYVGKTLTIVFTNKDCGQGAHWGYTYLDNLFATGCPDPEVGIPGQGSIVLSKSDSCGIGNICTKYKLPYVVTLATGDTTFGSVTDSIAIYQNNTFVRFIKGPTITSYSPDSTYCFSINPAALGLNAALGGFDYAVTGLFALSGFNLAPVIVGNPPGGIKAGVNNDYLITCPVIGNGYYSKATGALNDVLTWGVNTDGSGTNPTDFGAGKTFHLANRGAAYTLTANWIVGGSLDIPAGSQLRINGFTLSEAGLIGTGSLFGSITSNLIVAGATGGNAGALNFAGGGNTLNNFTLNRTGSAGSVAVASPVSIYGVVTLTAGALTTGNNITLKSTATGTARVAPVSGTVSGNVIVERYIPARRAWRLLSAPVGGSQTINQAWQEGATTASVNPNPNPGFGTFITEGTTNGFDHNTAGGVTLASVKRYVSASDTWVPLANTNATAVNGAGYLLFVRGSRSTPLGLNTVPAASTTLRATGALKTGNQTFAISTTGFTAVPNPYASPINFATITRTNVPNNFYLWDPKLGGSTGVGGYVLVSFNGSSYDITPSPVSPESQLIQSGQGFLVNATGAGASLVIKESDKSATAATNVFRADNTVKGFRTSLRITDADNTTAVLDETFTSYGAGFSDKVDNMDALKLANINENLGTIRGGKSLMIERRHEFAENDTIQLQLWNTTPRKYLLQFSPVNLSSTIVSGYVEDKYLHTTTPVSLGEITKVRFAVDDNAASADKDRFRVILVGKKSLSLDITSAKPGIRLSSNPISGNEISLQFTNQPEGTYNVTLMNSVGQEIFQGKVIHSGGTATQTLQLNNRPVKGIYRIRIISGQKKIASAMPVLIN